MTGRLLSIAQLTALPLATPDLVQLAADAGCRACGLRLLPASPGGAHYPLMHSATRLAETLARMQALDVAVFDLEIIRIGAGFDPLAYGPFFEAGQRLGARAVLVAGDDADEARLTAHFARLCEAAAPYGLSCDLEFMPWTAVGDARTAARIVQSAGQRNGGVLVDALHFARSGTTLDDVAALPRSALHYAQICDGKVPGPETTEGLIHDARCERLLPGEGGIALAELFARLPADLPVSIETPSDTRAPKMGYLAWARAAVAATRQVLGLHPLSSQPS
ncbi:MAG: TIM barrel protein [Burkholderiales bacterium]|nr:TIM barrel protein [Burkholderiales bacterium]